MGYLVSDEQLNGFHSPLYYHNTNRFLDVRKRKIDADFFSLGDQQWWWGRGGGGGCGVRGGGGSKELR